MGGVDYTNFVRGDGWTDGRTDGRADGRTNGQWPNNVPPDYRHGGIKTG